MILLLGNIPSPVILYLSRKYPLILVILGMIIRRWPGGPSGAIAPIERVLGTVEYAISVVKKSKQMLGIPQYAYDWTIKGEKKTGTAYSTQRAIDLYTGYQSLVHYDEKVAAPWFRYIDKYA